MDGMLTQLSEEELDVLRLWEAGELVLVKHSYWKGTDNVKWTGNSEYGRFQGKCANCNAEFRYTGRKKRARYCYCCGARMDGRELQ